jgi:putative N6-adenine-specific DNA methylase
MKENNTEKYEMIAKTFSGLEPVLAKELEEIGAKNITPGRRMVSFIGDNKCMYKANIFLRTAMRVLKPIYSTTIKTQDDFYNYLRNIEWEKHMNLHHSFAIDSVINTKIFTNSLFTSQRSKDAIVDRFRDKYHKRPLVDTKEPKILINIHISGEQLNISLDSSGEPLNKRGYRSADGGAPLNEVLAAAMILYSDWDPVKPFVDPMTGSGTLAIEAAMIARNIPPGMLRKNYSFQNWPDYNKELYREIIEGIELNEIRPKIYANDILEDVVEIAKQNARNALVSSFIKFSNTPMAEYVPRRVNEATIILNPPYGERLKPGQIEELYSEIGTSLKNNFSGSTAWLITSNKEAFKKIGLRYKKRMELYNGGLLCWYAGFEMFDGSYKEFKSVDSSK